VVEDGEPLPSPSSLEAIMADPANGDAVAFLVSLPEAPDRTVRVNITLPERLLRRIDARGKTVPRFWPAPRKERSPRVNLERAKEIARQRRARVSVRPR